MATALVTQIAYAVQTLFDPAGTAGRLVDLGKLANYGLLTSFTPAYLFTTGVNGTWYDPSDYTTLYQDAAGTLPVTAVEQPVGLMLDKSKGLVLGPELVTNGDFSNGVTGWTAQSSTFSVTAGVATITNIDTSVGRIDQSFVTTAGKTYKVTATFANASGGSPGGQIYIGTSAGSFGLAYTSAAVGAVTLYFTAPSSIIYLSAVTGTNTAGASIQADNISVRELPGNHAFNSSGNSANFPVLSARYNLLTKTEQFDDAVWVKTNSTTTATSLTESATSSVHVIAQSVTYVATDYTFTVEFKPNGRTWIAIQARDAVSYFNLAGSGALGNTIGAVVNRSIVLLDDGYYRCSLTVTATAGANDVTIYLSSANGTVSYTGDGVSGVLLRKADLRVANDALNQPAYQRVNTSTDYDTVDFKPYLRFNGTNQWLQTNSIDFTYGDKMFVSAGVRKLSDAADGIIVESGISAAVTAGTFLLTAPGTLGSAVSYGALFNGIGGNNRSGIGANTYSAHITNVVTVSFDYAGASILDEVRLRINGVLDQDVTFGVALANRNFTDQPLYIGARAGSSSWFNGRLYGMVVAGKQASASEITSTETYLNQKTGAF